MNFPLQYEIALLCLMHPHVFQSALRFWTEQGRAQRFLTQSELLQSILGPLCLVLIHLEELHYA